jgi:type III pantothenate kinase
MLLAVDIGNTNTVLGAWSSGVLVAHWRIATEHRRMPDEYAVLLSSLFQIDQVPVSEVDGAIICGVVPSVQEALRLAIKSFWGLDAVLVSADMDLGMEILYSPPEAVGADRIANAVAAVEKYSAPAIVVDFGTATTIDAISSEGAYVGGSIAPGLQISVDALYARTARLRPVPLDAPTCPIGTDTTSSLQSGIIYGYAGLVDGLVRRFQDVLGMNATVIGTGGLAPVVVPHARTVDQVDLDLTLLGLRLLYDRNTDAGLARSRQNQSLA